MIPTRSLWHLALFGDLVVGDKLPRQASLITICNTTIQIKVGFCFIWRLVGITDDSDTKAHPLPRSVRLSPQPTSEDSQSDLWGNLINLRPGLLFL